ncbi:DUF3488 and DUF4129 domain-containing transglutaminase family protein [Microcella sp.]|uniref:transglutaminase TgpA family protein n=1 Tax=Microcella sp. TaxID=1913979 RepID=UPI00299F7B63|nr:transglutaminaseTgpA domain-containing protein [Microcella sp.]MDX2024771.1 transglutaminaseTgpA domain-containing protein [Microcella sp.]
MTERVRPRRSIGLSAAGVLAIAAASTAFSALIDEGPWGPTVLTVVVAAVAAAALVRVFVERWAVVWATVAAVAAAVIALTVLFAADTALLGVVPVPATVERFAALIGAGELSIAEQTIPAIADDGVRFIMASGVTGLAILTDAVLVHGRRPAFTAVPLLGILAVPVVLAPGWLPIMSVLVTAAAYLLMLALHRPAASGGAAAAGRALGVAAGVLVTALLVPPLLPPVIAGEALPGTGAGGLVAGVNPVLDLGNDLRRNNPVEALRYSTDADGGLYLTLSHLADFEGQSVEPVLGGSSVAADVVGPPVWLGSEVATETVVTSIRLQNVRSRWVPLPSAPVTIAGLAGLWVVDADGVTVSTVEGTFRNGSYQVESLVAAPTPLQLRTADVDAPDLERYRAVPEGLDPVVARTAASVASSAEGPSPYDQALALQRFFTSGDFVYSEEAPVEQGYDGTGADIVAAFLEARSGYCVHYAAAMTLMARTLGIPARIAVGFVPGTANPNVPGEFIVTTDDLHAWPELHFDGIGWVRFEPTPSRGAVPDYATDDVPAPGEEPAVDPVTGETFSPTPEATATTDPADPSATGPAADPSDLIDGGADGSLDGSLGAESTGAVVDARAIATVALSLLAALLVLPGLWRVRRRAARRRSPDPLDHWRELRDTARDLGLPADDTRTPRELAAAWAVQVGVGDAAVLGRVRSALEARAYGTAGNTAARDDLDLALRALRRSSPVWRRALAAVAPASLLDRIPSDERLIADALSA